MRKLALVVMILLGVGAAVLYRPAVSLQKLKKAYTYPDSHFTEIDQMDVHFRRSGSGPPVLLVHGTSSSLHTWQHWQEALSGHFTVYSVDLPGCGLTGPHPREDYSIQAYLEFLEAFTRSQGLDSFYIAGNSLGGHIAWKYAAASPRIKRAVLVDPSGFILADRNTPLVFRLGRKKIFASMAEGLNVKPLIRKSLNEVYYDDAMVEPQLVRRYYDLVRRKGNRKAFVQKVTHIESSTEEELQEIDIPVLVQWGREDLWIPLELADIFMNNLSNAELVIYPKCGHVPQEELPETSARDAIDFFKSDLPFPENNTL